MCFQKIISEKRKSIWRLDQIRGRSYVAGITSHQNDPLLISALASVDTLHREQAVGPHGRSQSLLLLSLHLNIKGLERPL